MALIIRDLLQGNPKLKELGFGEESLGHNAILGGFQGQRQWTDFYPNGDFAEAILNSSFDWNGIRKPFVLATENDSLNGVAMLLGHLVSQGPAIFADVRTYWSPEAVQRVTGEPLTGPAAGGIIHLINSGAASLDGSGRCSIDGKPAMKPFWEISQEEADACLDATVWVPANREYFRGGGFSSKFLSKGGMPCTMIRMNIVKNLGPVLQLAEGWTVVYSVMDNWGANHGAIVYGHVGADLITLCSMLRIPVCMHNVPEKDIFRPSTWRAFGMDPEGADYRACAAYGPLFKK